MNRDGTRDREKGKGKREKGKGKREKGKGKREKIFVGVGEGVKI